MSGANSQAGHVRLIPASRSRSVLIPAVDLNGARYACKTLRTPLHLTRQPLRTYSTVGVSRGEPHGVPLEGNGADDRQSLCKAEAPRKADVRLGNLDHAVGITQERQRRLGSVVCATVENQNDPDIDSPHR